MNRSPFPLFLLFCLVFAPAWGQQALTFQQCVTEASAHNLDLLAAVATVKADEAGHLASLGQFFPQITFNANIGQSGYGGLTDALNGGPGSSSPNSNLSLNATQDIFSGFKDFAAVDQANAQLDLARAQLTQAKAQLSHDLKVDFYTLLYTQQEITLLEDIVKRDQANQDLVQMNFDGGTDNKGSLMQVQAATQQDQYTVEQAKRALRVAQRNLDQVLGRNPMDDVVVQGDFEIPSTPGSAPNFVELTNLTPAHLEALAQLHLSEAGYVTARSVFLPTLSANAQLARSGWNTGGNDPSWSAGLELSFPLFTGGKDIFNLQSAEETKKGSRDALQSTDLKTESSLEGAYASYMDSLDEMKVQQFQVQAAQTQEEIGKAEYLNGLLIFQNWNLLETALTNQQKTELSDSLNIKTTEANWELTEGKGVIP
jgi:outer membrane protein TolC